MAMLEFIMELLFILFVLLMAIMGLMAFAALMAGVLFVVVGIGGWIMTLRMDDKIV
tara:strand:+ start:421 stop:588 length:168 start_codon:yes stop_codon:yes gene_type:complete